MMTPLDDRLPRDWRAALAVAVMTGAALLSGWKAMVAVAQAEVAPVRTSVEEMGPMVREVYIACVKRGECDGKAMPR